MLNSHNLGKQIANLRQNKQLTQDDLSDRVEIAWSTLSKIERGAIKNPSVFTIARIARELDVTLDALISGTIKTEAKQGSDSISFVYCDINGVLVRFFQRAFIEMAHDLDVNPEKLETIFWHYNDAVCRGEMSLSDFEAALAARLGVTGENAKQIDWQKYYMQTVNPITVMHDCLRAIAKKHPVGLLSNIFPGFIPEMIQRGLIPDLNYTVIADSSELGAIKPEMAMYEKAQELAGVPGEQILFIDDSRTNLMAANRLGWHVIWFDDYRPRESVERIAEALSV